MIPLGLDTTEQRAFERGLCSDHMVKVQTSIITLDHDTVGVATGRILSGQVDVDTSQSVKRTLQLELIDPDNALNLDAGGPWEAALYADRMVQVHYGVWSHAYPHWVNVPVFTGPISSLRRSGDTVSLTAHDKASLVLGPCSMNDSWSKGSRKTDVIRGMLGLAGELYFDIPGRSDKITSRATITSQDDLWKRAEELALTLGDVRLIYSGRGYATLRPRTSAVRWRFTGGTGGSLLTPPSIGYDLSETRNLVVVTGGIPAGAKRRIQAKAEAPANHPLAPARIGRNGRKRWLREDISDEGITSQAAADKLAKTTLEERLVAGVEMGFETMPIPHLEPHDVVEVVHEGQAARMALAKFTLPLGADGRMSIGKNQTSRRVTRQRATVITKRAGRR